MHRKKRNGGNVTLCTREFDQRWQEFGFLLPVSASGRIVSRQQRAKKPSRRLSPIRDILEL
jgi:hypothetical protein